MRIIDLYVSEVGRKLPAKNRSDIEAELKSTLMDMLEDRALNAHRDADESMAKEMLKEYGSPASVAATYQPAKYLIGPRIYPTFWTILKIVLFALGISSVVVLGIQLGRTGIAFPESAVMLGRSFLGWFQAAIQAFGTLVIVFALLERYAPVSKEITNEWEPEDLLKIEEPNRLSRAEVILSIIFATIGIVVFNFYPELISFYHMQDGVWISFPILTATFFSYLLWLNIIWILEIILHGLVLRDDEWTKPTRLFEIGISILNLVLLVVMVAGPSIVQLPLDWLRDFANMSAETAIIVQTQFATGIRVVLGLVAAITLLDTLRKVYQLWKK